MICDLRSVLRRLNCAHPRGPGQIRSPETGPTSVSVTPSDGVGSGPAASGAVNGDIDNHRGDPGPDDS
jgi:hypothetical protein